MLNIFLFISVSEEALWFQKMVKILSSMGTLQVVSQGQATHLINEHKYDMVIVDTASIDDESQVITKVHLKQPQARIVVITTTPTWRRAREVLLHSGAMDYISKTLSERELRSIFKDILAKTP